MREQISDCSHIPAYSNTTIHSLTYTSCKELIEHYIIIGLYE